VLPVIVAPAERKAILCPYDLGAHLEPGGLERLLDLARVQACVPDVGNGARKQFPGLAPVGAVIVGDLTQFARVEIYASALRQAGS
jgi:hypothetical protein